MKEYLIKKDGKYKGVMAFDVIIEGINNGKLEGADLVWYEDVIDWDRLDKAEDFKHLFNKKNPIILAHFYQPMLGRQQTWLS